MLIGDERAVTDLWEAARDHLPGVREDRPGQPVYVLDEEPAAGDSALRTATLHDLDLLVRTSAAAFLEEVGIDAYARDPALFEWRTRTQIEEGRSWLWEEDGTVLFKAEASAWTHRAVQLQQVWVDPLRARQGLRETRPRRPLPPSARAHPVRLPLRAPRERASDRPLRLDRHAPGRRVPLAHLRVVAIAT